MVLNCSMEVIAWIIGFGMLVIIVESIVSLKKQDQFNREMAEQFKLMEQRRRVVQRKRLKRKRKPVLITELLKK